MFQNAQDFFFWQYWDFFNFISHLTESFYACIIGFSLFAYVSVVVNGIVFKKKEFCYLLV